MKPLFNPYRGKALSFYRMVTRDRPISRGVRYFSHYLVGNCKKPLVFEVNQRGYLHIYRIEELATDKDCGLIRLYDLLLREKGDLYLKDTFVVTLTGTLADYLNSLEQLEKR